MEKLSRRSFLKAGTATAAGLAFPALAGAHSQEFTEHFAKEAVNAAQSVKGQPKLAISSYCYWGFRDKKDPIELVIDKAANIGVAGVDILHRQMDSEDNSYLQALKRRAYENGIDLVCLSIHQDFVDPSKEFRQKQVDHTIRCIELAYKMGIPAVRLNSGTWGTAGSFNNLMAARGIEKPIDGYNEDDAYGWIQDCIYKCLPKAEQCGVILALENHWGLSGTPEGMIRIKNSVKSDWLKYLADTGNFLEDPYDKLETIFPDCAFISCKTYDGGGTWYTLDLDYDRIVRQIHDVGYRGYITLEFEGKEDPETAVPKGIKMLKGYIDKYYPDTVIK